MKALTHQFTGLLLSLSLAGNALALQSPGPVNGINETMQMQIDQKISRSLDRELHVLRKSGFSIPATEEAVPEYRVDIVPVPDCNCQLPDDCCNPQLPS